MVRNARSARPRRLAVWMTALLAVAFAGCGDDLDLDLSGSSERVEGSGAVIEESRDLAEFDAVDLRGEGLVELGAGADAMIEIETDDNLVPLIDTDVVDGTLVISTREDTVIDPTDDVVYRLGCPLLSTVTLTGAGTIDLATCTTDSVLELVLLGAGTVAAPVVEAEELRADLLGAGTIRALGSVEVLDVSLLGAGEFDGGDLRATRANVAAPGAGSATVWVTDELDVSVPGVATVRYYGDPELTSSVVGVGNVESLGER